MKMDRRKAFEYRGVRVSPERGESRYFGAQHGEYLTRWWCVLFPDNVSKAGSHLLVDSKSRARGCIDYYLEHTTIPWGRGWLV